ncbi:MAG: hypothetical protein ACE5JL_09665, partial [Dehalococcoidia bacterium]
QACLVGLDSPQICDVESLFDELLEMGLASLMFHSTPNLAGTSGWPTTTVKGSSGAAINIKAGLHGNNLNVIGYGNSGPAVEAKVPLAYFGTPITALIQEKLCGLKPQGLGPQGLGAFLPKTGLPHGDACVFSLVSQGWEGPGDRILQCQQKYALNPAQINPVAYRLPVPECGGTDGDITEKALNAVIPMNWTSLNKGVRIALTIISPIWVGPTALVVGAIDKAIGLVNLIRDAEPIDKTDNKSGSKNDTPKNKEENNEKQKDENDRSKDQSNKQSRPVEPGSGGCAETAAMRRAQLMFDCVFGGPQIGVGGGLAPVVNPGPGGSASGLPEACSAVNPSAFFGNSGPNGGGVTDPEGPGYWSRRGPTNIDPHTFWNDSTGPGVINPVNSVGNTSIDTRGIRQFNAPATGVSIPGYQGSGQPGTGNAPGNGWNN